jgi:hypothetical protein
MSEIRRRRFLAGAALAGGSIGAPAVVRAQGRSVFNWKMTSAYVKGSPFYMDGPGSATDLARRIREMSDGRLNIQVFGAGELVPAFEGFDAVRAGTVEMNHANSYFWTGKTFAAQYFTAVPFGMNFQGMNGWLYDGGGQQLWNEVYEPFGMIAMPCGNTGVQMSGWFKKEITSVADLKGLKMRIPGLAGRVYANLGVDVKVLPGGEIFPALERGRVRRPVPGPAPGPAKGREVLLHDRLARVGHRLGAAHQQGRVAEAAQGPAVDRRERRRRLQRDQRGLVPAQQLRGDGGPDPEPEGRRAPAARRGDQGAARGDRKGARRGDRQGPADQEGARVLLRVQGEVRPLVRDQRGAVPRQGPRLTGAAGCERPCAAPPARSRR